MFPFSLLSWGKSMLACKIFSYRSLNKSLQRFACTKYRKKRLLVSLLSTQQKLQGVFWKCAPSRMKWVCKLEKIGIDNAIELSKKSIRYNKLEIYTSLLKNK